MGLMHRSASACSPGLPCVVNAKSGQNDSKSDSEACDGDVMNQMYARAFLEGEREVVIAESEIRKPDSVFELTCFDQLAYLNAKKFNPIFSESDETYVKNLVIEKFDEDNEAVFYHKFLARSDGSDVDYETGNAEQDPYNCDMMNSINFIARCMDFETDGPRFLSFEQLTSVDPRDLPQELSCDGTAVTQEYIDVSVNKDGQYVQY